MIAYEFFCSLIDYELCDVANCFIDEFNNLSQRGRMLTIKQEPMRGQGNKETRAFYAALCEFYSNWYHLPQPSWMFKDEYYLQYKWHPYTSKDELHCPIEFKSRNIIIGQNDIINS